MTTTLTTTHTLPTPYNLTNHLALPVEYDSEMYCPDCGDYLGKVAAYQNPWMDLDALDNEIHTLYAAHLYYNARPTCG